MQDDRSNLKSIDGKSIFAFVFCFVFSFNVFSANLSTDFEPCKTKKQKLYIPSYIKLLMIGGWEFTKHSFGDLLMTSRFGWR